MNRIWWKKWKLSKLRTLLRGLLGLIIFCSIVFILYLEQKPYGEALHEGDVCLRAIYAPFDFTYKGEVDEVATETLRQQARATIVDVFDLTRVKSDKALEDLDIFFKKVAETRALEEPLEEEGKVKLLEGLVPSLPDSAFRTLLRAKDLELIKKDVHSLLSSISSKGLIQSQDKEALKKAGKKKLVLRNIQLKTEQVSEVSDMMPLEEAREKLPSILAERPSFDRGLAQATEELAKNFLATNLAFNKEETELRRQQAAKNVPPQHRQLEAKKEELIINKGQRVSKLHLAMLSALSGREARTERPILIFGIASFIALFMAATVNYLKFYESRAFQNTNNLILIGILVLALVIVAKLVTISPWPSYTIPLASVSMLLAILINPRVAVVLTICLCIIVGIMVGNNINMAATFLIGGIVGIRSVRDVRRRSHLLRAGFLVGGANFLAISSLGILNNLNYTTYFTEGHLGFLNGVVCAFIIMGSLPLFERLFGLTTDITLLELSDMNLPLLRELTLKAPGTYHHSLVVGNLAEAASEAVGANSLLARVGSYYHDIGKMEKAEYFSENQPAPKVSIHDKLTPSMSRLIITNHVKDGVDLGKKHNLSPVILEFVEQHHGTGLIYYFFQKALERAEDQELLKEEGYRYPGPKPQTRETAIVLLADSVEAASRTLPNPNPSRLEELVHRIINNKFIDGQLDECDLTLKNLNKIAKAFIRILAGIYHARIEYPEEKPPESKEKRETQNPL